MSIVSTSNRWLNRLYKAIAIILVLLAVLISAFRLFLPYVPHYKNDLQDYLNSQNQTNIKIGSLSMTWHGEGPTLLIGQVTALDNKQVSFKIDELALQIDFWRSINEGRFISGDVILSGVNVYIDQRFFQQGNSSEKPTVKEDITGFETIANVFLNRISRFSLRDSQIIVNDNDRIRSFRINQLNWANSDTRHQAQGTIVVNGLSSNNLQVKMDLQGNTASKLTGLFYLQANHIDMTPWLNQVLVLDDEKTETDINFSAWLKVEKSTISSLQIELDKSAISWSLPEQEKTLSIAKGQLLLLSDGGERSFNLFSTPLTMKVNDELTQEVTLTLNKNSGDFTAHLSAIDLAVLSELPPLFIASKSQQDLLQDIALNGKVDDVFIRYQQEKLAILADFSEVSNQYSQNIPGIENVSGQLSFVDNYLSFNLLAEQGLLDFDKHFETPFPYDTLTVQANVEIKNDGWLLTVNQLELLSKAINLSTQIHINAPDKADVTMALLADITDGNAGMVGKYLPLSIMSENLVTYLNDAIISGDLKQAQVLLNGPLANFPYTDGTGIFVVDAELSDSTFKFAEHWPAITDFSANLNFTNNSMLITGRAGQLTGLDVEGVAVDINDLSGKQILTVDAAIAPVLAQHVNSLIQQSPLKESVGSALTHLNVSGNISGAFDLILPLNDPDNAIASGLIDFSNNKIALQAPNIELNNINGQLSFLNDKISTKDVSLTWQELPLSLIVTGQEKLEYYNTDIEFEAKWQPNNWQRHIPEELLKYFAGDINWKGLLSLHQHHQGGFSYDLNLDSTLIDTKLNLPIPYGKNSDTEKPLIVKVSGQLDKSKISVELEHQLSFFGVLDHDTTSFSRAHLVIGDDTMLLPMDGFHITTKLRQADFSAWQPLISDILTSIKSPNTDELATVNTYKPLFAKPKRIRGTVGELAVLGQTLNNVSFNLFDKKDWWLLQLNAKETRSQIKLYSNWLEQGMEIKSEFIHLAQGSNNTPDENVTEFLVAEASGEINNKILTEHTANIANDDVIFDNIPPLSLQCDRCQIGLLNLGKVNFTLERSNDAIQITGFTADREQANINLTATWLKNETISKTTVLGELLVESVEHELNLLGYDSIIRDSGGKLDFDINWQGGPHEFELAKLNGNFQANLDDGYLADVPDKARIFSVLSLKSLVRKLTLDFRDIFSDGMFYSSIKGDYNFKNGVLYTDSTKMDGTAGNLLMTGSTDLVSGGLDYKMSYKPNLSSSLPVMAWIVTLNPVTFLAGVAIDQVIKSQVVSEFNFALTGTVNEPDFKVIDRKMKEVSVGRTQEEVVDTLDNQSQETDIDTLESPRLRQYQLQRKEEPKSDNNKDSRGGLNG
jgi:uncharacterized protein (TIGR02099 family)